MHTILFKLNGSPQNQNQNGAGKMAEQVKALDIKHGDLGLNPRIHKEE